MTVKATKLIQMAEQIAANISTSRDPAQVADRLADHLRRFWDPRMRSALIAHARAQPEDLDEVLRLAVARLPQDLPPT